MAEAATVVVITRDRRHEVLATLRRLRSLPERPPVIVIDNGSQDGTTAAVTALADDGVTVRRLRTNLGAAARDVGLHLATTPLVAFSDDDSWWAPGALARAADHFARHARLALLAARILVGPDERLDPTCDDMRRSPLPDLGDLPGPPVLGFVACGAVVRRSAVISAGGFAASAGVGGEETSLALSLAVRGWGLAYVDDVVAHHHPSADRSPSQRRRHLVANDLLTAWRLRRLPAAVGITGAVLAEGLRDPATRAGLVRALPALATALRARRPVPPWLDDQIRSLE